MINTPHQTPPARPVSGSTAERKEEKSWHVMEILAAWPISDPSNMDAVNMRLLARAAVSEHGPLKNWHTCEESSECIPCDRTASEANPRSVCPYCDDTGDVHSIDGQWRGRCVCVEERRPATWARG